VGEGDCLVVVTDKNGRCSATIAIVPHTS
jgi:hypothetical protein